MVNCGFVLALVERLARMIVCEMTCVSSAMLNPGLLNDWSYSNSVVI